MCGIAGAVGSIDESIEKAVQRMADTQAHRGPDDSGSFVSGHGPGVAFGFRRLAIIDLSSDGHQPMHDPETGNVIVFNGEIYNYAELKSELASDGPFRSKSDTEVLLRAYRRWGKDMLRRLRGMFGFCIYDPKRRQAFLVRDRLGIKPIYFAVVERAGKSTLLFSSELRSLLATGLVAKKLDPLGVDTYLWNGFVVGPSTMVEGVELLEPGASLTLDLDAPSPRPERYWQLASGPTQPADVAIRELARELDTAVEQHLMADVPLGVFLSGGVDSSAIAALAVRANKGKVATFHIGFDEAAFDESRYARSVAQALDTEHSEFRLTQERFRSELDAALRSLDQPTLDAINTYFVSRVVREAGFTVALAGTGGDELFGGYRSFRDLPIARRVSLAGSPVPESLFGRGVSLANRLRGGSASEVPPQTRWGKLADALACRGDLVRLYQVSYGLYTRDFLGQLASPRVRHRASFGLTPERAESLARSLGGEVRSEIGRLELAMFIGERLLRDSDAASMAVSLELRVPLLDHRVVEAAQAVPDAARFFPLGRKMLLRELSLNRVPPSIFDRPKAGFVLPIEVWAKDQLAPQIEQTFADRALVESAGLDADALGRLWRSFRAGAPGLYWSRIWAPYVLLDWCRREGVALA